jgi:hypothetical protein
MGRGIEGANGFRPGARARARLSRRASPAVAGCRAREGALVPPASGRNRSVVLNTATTCLCFGGADRIAVDTHLSSGSAPAVTRRRSPAHRTACRRARQRIVPTSSSVHAHHWRILHGAMSVSKARGRNANPLPSPDPALCSHCSSLSSLWHSSAFCRIESEDASASAIDDEPSQAAERQTTMRQATSRTGRKTVRARHMRPREQRVGPRSGRPRRARRPRRS